MAMLLRRSARSARNLFSSQHAFGRQQVFKPATRCFSSSSDDSSPKFDRGFELAARLWRRCIDDMPKLQEYQEKNVFSSNESTLGQVLLFAQLNLPQKTSIDLIEFLEGARLATEEKLRFMNCEDFPKFLAEEEGANSEVANSLQQFTTPAYYNQMALQVKTSYLRRRRYIECEQMSIEKAQLSEVLYRRLTEKEYSDLVEFKKPATGVSPGATVEHLRLHVDVSTVEDLNLVHLEDKTYPVQQQNVYRVVFESQVTDPEEVDWRIESMHLLEQKAIPRSPETPATSDETKTE